MLVSTHSLINSLIHPFMGGRFTQTIWKHPAQSSHFTQVRVSTHSFFYHSFIHALVVGSCRQSWLLNQEFRQTSARKKKCLPRSTRYEITRLRSGFSRKLNYYLNRIDDSFSDSCPDCSTSPHTTDHLFICTANDTELDTSSVWTNPIKAAMIWTSSGREW